MAEQEYYIAKLKKIMMFRYLTDESLREIVRISDLVNYKRDDRIISEGEVSQYLYAILDGAVNVSVRKDEGQEVFLGIIGAGDVFGEAGIFLSAKRIANVISTENTSILRISRKDLLDFIKKQPRAGVKILMVVIYSLLNKLRDADLEIAFERKADIAQDDIDSIVDSFMKED